MTVGLKQYFGGYTMPSLTLPRSLRIARIVCIAHLCLSAFLVVFVLWALDNSPISGFLLGLRESIHNFAWHYFSQPIYTPEAAGNIVGMILLPALVAWGSLWAIRVPTVRKSYIFLLLLFCFGLMGSIFLLLAAICFLPVQARQHLKISNSTDDKI